MNCPNCNYEDGNDEKSFGNITLDGPLTIANFYDCPRCGVLFFDRGYTPYILDDDLITFGKFGPQDKEE